MDDLKTRELLGNEAFLEKFTKTESAEQAKELLKTHNIEISVEELLEMRSQAARQAELSDDELGDIAGGGPSMTASAIVYGAEVAQEFAQAGKKPSVMDVYIALFKKMLPW